MKILVVDDHPLILEALRQLLPQLNPGTEVCVAHDRDEAEAALEFFARQIQEAGAGSDKPAGEPLTPWEKLAQVLLATNEFVFVD